ncbi:hypothetical protein ACFXKI_42985 [Streptomyces mirabilis]|uniref:hypothetical protein n=1 Tax=Streptomyces mirabilis TaxID=68239 RepID=UPI0036A56DBE
MGLDTEGFRAYLSEMVGLGILAGVRGYRPRRGGALAPRRSPLRPDAREAAHPRLRGEDALAFTTRVLGVDVVVEDLDLRALRKPWPFRESRAGSGRGR